MESMSGRLGAESDSSCGSVGMTRCSFWRRLAQWACVVWVANAKACKAAAALRQLHGGEPLAIWRACLSAALQSATCLPTIRTSDIQASVLGNCTIVRHMQEEKEGISTVEKDCSAEQNIASLVFVMQVGSPPWLYSAYL